MEDHPRTCGEKLCKISVSFSVKGSPPHMRGKAIRPSFCTPFQRITPAHAGKSFLLCITSAASRDHPRTCGEKFELSWLDYWDLGSPPHMRGKGIYKFLQQGQGRITPAHAGKRWSSAQSNAAGKDHPRTCGEKRTANRVKCAMSGSPPHMRGKAAYPCVIAYPCGITPAHAGKSYIRSRLG